MEQTQSLRDINMQLRQSNDEGNEYPRPQEPPMYNEKRVTRPAGHVSSKIKVRFIPSGEPAFSVLLHTKPSVGDVFLLNNVRHHVVKVERMLFQPENSMVREGRIHVFTYTGPSEETESGR
jgi:hypothetical protein